jgi:hypothetical protein
MFIGTKLIASLSFMCSKVTVTQSKFAKTLSDFSFISKLFWEILEFFFENNCRNANILRGVGLSHSFMGVFPRKEGEIQILAGLVLAES